MPIYAYRCATCGHAKDVLQKVSDALLITCPACGAQAFQKQVTAAGFQLKGSGWYVTDFKGDANKKALGGDTAKSEPSGDTAKGDAAKGDAKAPEAGGSKAEPTTTTGAKTGEKSSNPAAKPASLPASTPAAGASPASGASSAASK
jgi:putative FmdB family regulatory protein